MAALAFTTTAGFLGLVSAIALACCASSGEGAFSCRFLLKHSPMHGFKGGKASQGAGGGA
jgi:hypothetical protein